MQKKIPMRQCVGCREMKAKKELVRVVRSPEGEISLDFRGKAPGRGAYVCPQAECLRRAIKSRALERGLDCQIPQEIYDQLLLRMEAGDQDGPAAKGAAPAGPCPPRTASGDRRGAGRHRLPQRQGEASIGSKGRRRPYLPPGTLLCFGQQMPVYLRAVHKRRAGKRSWLQCLRAVRVYRSRVCKIVS